MRRLAYQTSLPIILAMFTACGGGTDKPGETGQPTGPGTGPTDTEDTEPTFDEGCITVNGGAGYAKLQDAITVAGDGDTIALCGDLDEAVIVSGKAVTITGEGVDTTAWTGPTNEVPITVREGGSAIVRDLTLHSTRSGVVVDAAYLELIDVDIPSSGGYGIESNLGTVVATRVNITDAPWGGARASGGSLELTGSTIERTVTAGVLGEAGAQVIVSNTTIRDTNYVDDGSGSIADGFGIWVKDGSTLETHDNTLINNILAGLYIEDSTATLSGDSADVQDTGLMFLGMYIDNSTVDATDLQVSGYYQWGHYGYSADVVYNNSSFVADPLTSLQSSLDGSTLTQGSMGVVAVDGSVTLNNSSSSGNNSAGVWAESTAGDVLVVLNGAVIDDNWERGLYVYEGELIATDTVVSNTHNNDAVCVDPSTGSQSCNMAMFAIGATTSFTGGEVHDNDGWGLAGLEANVMVDGTTFRDNDFVSIFVQSANVSVQNSVFEGVGNFGIYLNTATGLVTDSTFVDRTYDAVLLDWDGLGGYADYHYQAIDVYAYSSDLVVEDTVFDNSQYGLYASGAQLVANDIVFDNTNQPILMYSATDAELDGIEANGGGATVVDCSDSTVTVSNADVKDTQPYVYSYEYYNADGSVNFTGNSSVSSSAIDGYRCDLTVEDSTFEAIEAEAVYGYESSLEIDDVSVRDSGKYIYTTAAIEVYNYSEAPDAEITSVEITGQRVGSGIYVANYSGLPGYVNIAGASLGLPSPEGFSGIASYGLYTYAADITIDGIDIANTGYTALYASNVANLSVLGASGASTGMITDTANYGIESWSSTVSITDLTVESAPLSGMFASDSSVSTSNFTVLQAGSYGIDCSGTVEFPTCDANLEGDLGDLGVFCPPCDAG